jgi:hypothetical protein
MVPPADPVVDDEGLFLFGNQQDLTPATPVRLVTGGRHGLRITDQ